MTKTILSPQEFEERRALILALLEEAHYTIGNLAALMRLHRGAVAMALKTLAREQQVHRGADDRWRLGAREVKATSPRSILTTWSCPTSTPRTHSTPTISTTRRSTAGARCGSTSRPR
jgi:hypothetical protein